MFSIFLISFSYTFPTFSKISIHAPAKGVTYNACYRNFSISNFNPHSHKGSDSILSSGKKYTLISIHTPTKGVTLMAEIARMRVSISIHTPTKGVTLNPKNSFACFSFQSTLPQREWRICSYCLEIYNNFNPHSHKGSDLFLQSSFIITFDFNPHSHKGSDEIQRGFDNQSVIFQSTLPQREWRVLT